MPCDLSCEGHDGRVRASRPLPQQGRRVPGRSDGTSWAARPDLGPGPQSSTSLQPLGSLPRPVSSKSRHGRVLKRPREAERFLDEYRGVEDWQLAGSESCVGAARRAADTLAAIEETGLPGFRGGIGVQPVDRRPSTAGSSKIQVSARRRAPHRSSSATANPPLARSRGSGCSGARRVGMTSRHPWQGDSRPAMPLRAGALGRVPS
jgi:hypothetical protein